MRKFIKVSLILIIGQSYVFTQSSTNLTKDSTNIVLQDDDSIHSVIIIKEAIPFNTIETINNNEKRIDNLGNETTNSEVNLVEITNEAIPFNKYKMENKLLETSSNEPNRDSDIKEVTLEKIEAVPLINMESDNSKLKERNDK